MLYDWSQADPGPALGCAMEKHIGQEPLSDDLTLTAIAAHQS
jgi:hypothetical protein